MADPTIAFPVGPTVTRADLPGLCADLAGLLRGRPPGIVTCHVTGASRRDVVTVEALARLAVTARRHGWRLVVAGVDPDLRLLVGLLGLSEALPEAGRQPERREQAVGVEEAGDRPDPPR